MSDAGELESDVVDALEGAGLLTRRQAQAYLLRHHTPLTRQQAADELGISVGVFDDHRGEADRKVEAARATVDVLGQLEGDGAGDDGDYLEDALRRGRPAEPCECDECDCELHTYPEDDRCAWCREGDHGPDREPTGDDVDELEARPEAAEELLEEMDDDVQEESDDEPTEDDDALDCGHESDDVVELESGARVCPSCAGVDPDRDRPDLEELAADLELPGDGPVLEARREAVLACARYLEDRGQAQKSDFQSDVYREHDGRYQSPGGWWNAIGKQGLDQLAEDVDAIEPPAGEGAHTWYWVE